MSERLSEQQEVILYRLSILQDEQGRQSSMKLKSEITSDPFYTELIDLEYLTFEQYGEGPDAIASLIVTLKGQRYLYEHLDEISKLDRESRPQF
ncbi:MAG: hypothetical protein ACOYIP_01530 [Coriobacteriales bacterium]